MFSFSNIFISFAKPDTDFTTRLTGSYLSYGNTECGISAYLDEDNSAKPYTATDKKRSAKHGAVDKFHSAAINFYGDCTHMPWHSGQLTWRRIPYVMAQMLTYTATHTICQGAVANFHGDCTHMSRRSGQLSWRLYPYVKAQLSTFMATIPICHGAVANFHGDCTHMSRRRTNLHGEIANFQGAITNFHGDRTHMSWRSGQFSWRLYPYVMATVPICHGAVVNFHGDCTHMSRRRTNFHGEAANFYGAIANIHGDAYHMSWRRSQLSWRLYPYIMAQLSTFMATHTICRGNACYLKWRKKVFPLISKIFKWRNSIFSEHREFIKYCFT